ncbi:hypothetical protein ACFWXK_39490 [Streptomyces sp. NPDC059070]|uniref:hypothetical protein n=1 Tax=Streptomyces sp. NPDC059070 TaxID=3346713 RepID=UPI0036758E7E
MPDEPSLTTRQLAAGVHLDARYREAVIGELHDHRNRYSAPSPDVDTVALVTEALGARRTATVLGGYVALLWFAGFVFTGALFALYAAACAVLLGAAALARPRHWAARTAAGCLRVLGGAALAGYAVLAGATAGDAGWLRTTAAFGFPLLTAGLVGAHRAAVELRLRVIGSPSYRLRRVPSGRHTAELLDRERTSSVVFHRPDSPFLGAGPVRESLGLTVEVRGHEGPFARPPALTRIARAVGNVPGLADSVEDCFLYPEAVAPPRNTFPRLPHELPAGPRWLRIVSGSRGPHPVTVFVQVRLDGTFLSLQQVTCALPPVREDFAYALGEPPAATGRALVRALTASPRTAAALLTEVAAWPVRRVRRSARAGRRTEAARVSVRELAAAPALPALAAAEADRVARTVRLLVLDAVREDLRDQGLHAPGLGGPAEVRNEQVGDFLIGNSRGAVAMGDNSRAVTRHTSPGPTTNPDDDSWEDDDLG